MARLDALTGANARERSTESDGGERGGSGPGRALLAVLGIAAAVYLLLRWRRRDADVSLETFSETVSEGTEGLLENAQPIEIGDPSGADESGEAGDESEEGGDGESEEGGDDETAASTGTGGGDEPNGEPSLDASTTDRSPEEIDERTESDVQDEPAEPGEMAIDEEVADEVLDEDDDR